MYEYDHGKRITPEVWELSPLDLSIEEYEKRCRDYYYRKSKKVNETEAERKVRLDKLKLDRNALDLERRRIMCMITVESGVQAYRDEFKHLSEREKIAKYKEEEHHPTDVLAQNMRAVGRAAPNDRFTAHHLVEGKGKLPITKSARMKLFFADIRINDPDNGVWMPISENDRGHWAMPKAVPHSRIHTHNYERWVWGEIEHLEFEPEIRAKLTILRGHLKNGTQPEKVTLKPDPKWDGRS